MSNKLVSAIILVMLLGCMLATLVIRAMIIAEINSRRDAHSQIWMLDRDFFGTFRLHRQIHPQSPLRMLMILSLVLSMSFGLGFTLVQNLSN